MNTSYSKLIFGIASFLLISCNSSDKEFDASGTFEAEETMISSEATGIIQQFNIEEGQNLSAGQVVGYIDSTEFYLKKKLIASQINALLSKKPNAAAQMAALQSQLKTAEKERVRISNLVKNDVVPQKQLDDINYQIDLVNKQLEGLKSSLNISVEGINKDAVSLDVQLDQVNDQLSKCRITNPSNGTVLTKYANQNEMAVTGKPLYLMADLSNIILRAYITGNQLSQLKLNQKVKVFTDNGKDDYKQTEGTVIWINNKAEFTPKSIQTKNERENMVYAIKVKVKNNGYLKIGMYGEILWSK